MRLELEKSSREISSGNELREALSTVGKGDNGFAVLSRGEQRYIQTAVVEHKGFLIEFRDGSEDRHYYSKRRNFSQQEMTDIFFSYYEGREDWVHLLQWEPPFDSSRRAEPQPKRKLATYRNAMIALIVGALAFFGSQMQRDRTEDLERHLGQTTGKVLSVKVRHHNKSSDWFYMTVRYAVDGKEFIVNELLSPRSVRVGDIVPIVFDKRDPGGTCFARNPEGIWSEYYFFLVSSGISVITGVVLFIIARITSSSGGRSKTARR